ncbi:MAG: glycine oxidase ThiO [Candidatus Eremiobacteraeota bacterium]|nr:glycine oxidase ThiO [Candidatus Eremiobacteraeota bacterium]
MSPGGDVAVIGGGLIGLAIAFELAERGATVRLYDRDEPARAASWAGAGMLAPYTERVADEELLQLCEDSLAEYPPFVERVREASGVDPQLHLNGIVHAAFDEVALERLREHGDALRSRGVTCDLLDRAHVLAVEPWLAHHVAGGLLVAGEGHVDNRRLGRALVAACAARGVSFARVASLRVECDTRRALGVRTNVGFTPAVAVVNACGAWSSLLDGVPPEMLPAVEPIKGQMLALQVPDAFVRRATWVPDAYVVPRDDGRLLVGATSERAQFDMRVTAEGLHRLLHAVLQAAPSLAAFTVTETWTGLRPGTADGRPFLGPTPLEGLYVATGHYRNGILLAPATARLLADAVCGNAAPELAAFSLPRRKRAS